ncbi:MAG TPA: sialate O-acetylesterase, partial [Chthoniobacteraceae bacterium]|nr:sialate O-acetylesterase [Chthoniobacteraceae bacterium]
HAEVRLPAIISDNMVLQQKSKATIWGDADPNEKVTVKIAGATQSVTAGVDGHWAMKLSPLKPGGPYEMTITGRNKITIENVMVGEVWVCAGQSNMAWPLRSAKDAQSEIAAAQYPKIRVFTLANNASPTRQAYCDGKWIVCDPSKAGDFSAVAYFFGREIFDSQKIPVGLIVSASTGPSKAEDWIPADGLDLDPDLRTLAAGKSGDAEMEKEEYKRRYAGWVEASAKAKEDNQPAPPEPQAPGDDAKAPSYSTLFNGMISPILPCSIRGVAWYQGEANTGNPQLYRKLFPVLIRSWRQSWGQGDFPFLFVQLPGFRLKQTLPGNSEWAELREAQAMALKLPKTGMAVTIDIGEDNIHPADKQDVGRRLALLARADVYGDDNAASGPVFSSSKAEGNHIVIDFKQLDGGLVAKDGQALKGFAIAGADKKFVWADAKIVGDTVVVSSDQVATPVAVRYAWGDNPDCNLFGKGGLPAAPFRTDNW